MSESAVGTIVRRRLRSPGDVADIERSRPEDLLPAQTVLDCLRAAAAEHPDKPAIVQLEPPQLLEPARTLGYADLVAGIEGTANLFHEVADGSASVVAVLLPMVPEGLTALWGAQTAGVAVPVNPVLEAAALIRILTETRATAVVTTREILDAKGGAQALHDQVPTLRAVWYVDDPDPAHDLVGAAAAYRGRGLGFEPNLDPWRDAMVMPTGGTTGVPKLVRMSQAGQLRVCWNVGALMGNEPDTVTAHGMPNFHCGGSISLGLRTVLFGGTLLTLSRQGFRSREVIARFWDIARHFRVTTLLATPTTALALLHGGGSAEGCCIRDFHVGGSALPMDLVQGFHDRFGIWLRENWGMTELHGTTTGHYNDGSMPQVGSAGRVLPWVRVKSVELDATGAWLRDCEPGERGVLLTATPTVTAGYLNPELNREFFPRRLPDDLPPGWRWGNTGDIGTVDGDGYVWVFGRAKDVIIRGGHNIDPKQIEDALALHPSVHLAAAVGRPDRAKGELPIVYVELRDGADAEPEELLAFCRRHVQEQAATPVEVVVVDRMPLTPVGKVSKPALRANALLRAVRAVVDLDEAIIELDESGPRRRVLVTAPGDPAAVDEVTRRLSGYEFECRVQQSYTSLDAEDPIVSN